MVETVQVMVQVEKETLQPRELAMPDVPTNGAILRMEAVGICGSDVSSFRRAPKTAKILGHENVGRIYRIGTIAEIQWDLHEGDLVALEEYLSCHNCAWCHRGEYRHCWASDIHNNVNALRYGSTALDVEPGLWGGYGQYLYMPYQSVWHRVPAGLTATQACLHIALGNGVQWAIVEGGAGPGMSVLIQGPGQMGVACVVAARWAGAYPIIVTGLTADKERLEVAKRLGAHHVIDSESEDVRGRVAEITNDHGVDVAIDTTSAGAGDAPILTAIDCLRVRGGTMVIQGDRDFSHFPVRGLADHYITLKQCRGHSYASVEQGLQIMASGRFDLDLMQTHHFPLADAPLAIEAAGGAVVDGRQGLHVAILP